ncbi:Uncharacterised protein [Salmonella enterica subsp. enterica serovar Bovismorbificans]|nr:Uncharacterised protein [Salmonella enterica subsp. enterica serovar Bovismorbificans]CNU43552.1 Uncharacterised protein [Salmonella enterica subsp. enterica serovar Bovismorbificans]CNU62565.1 Uncharacterised protein [Salmonella enterica subsp. enterica serovar Bovismorbificans]CNV18866.1 Uncharacterised protein [Salmonella enterica subsp. enterica serovar Bovismorbificans]
MHGQRQRLRRRDGRFFRHVGGQHDVSWPACGKHFTQYAVNFETGVLFIQYCAGSGYRLTHAIKMTKIAVTEGVVHQFASLLRSATGRADDMQDRDIFRVTARDTVNSAKFSHAKGGE